LICLASFPNFGERTNLGPNPILVQQPIDPHNSTPNRLTRRVVNHSTGSERDTTPRAFKDRPGEEPARVDDWLTESRLVQGPSGQPSNEHWTTAKTKQWGFYYFTCCASLGSRALSLSVHFADPRGWSPPCLASRTRRLSHRSHSKHDRPDLLFRSDIIPHHA
jgi:hypothetical protein